MGAIQKTKLDARGILATFSYDALNRVTQIVYPDETVTYTWDSCTNGKGRLCSISDKSGTTTYTHDLWGRVTGKSQAVGSVTQAMGYAFNSAGQLSTVTTPSGRSVVYTILGPWESKPEQNVLSYESELGAQLLGLKPGDETVVHGERYEVAKIAPAELAAVTP